VQVERNLLRQRENLFEGHQSTLHNVASAPGALHGANSGGSGLHGSHSGGSGLHGSHSGASAGAPASPSKPNGTSH
jgi:hypothetical protein